MKRILLSSFSVLCLFTFSFAATVKWDGGGNDGLWSTATNWSADAIPIAGDNVILDNSVVTGSYTVNLPGGIETVTISSLTITPSGVNNITLVLPVTNTSPNAFLANGTGDAVILNKGAIFINSSGGTGTPLSVTSTNFFRINNGGRYIHRTQAGHTNYLVSRLSTVAGTENGIFEFDIPASSTISLSGRTYGTLVLSSAAKGSPLTYSGNGTVPLNINGDLIINSGASLSLGLSADMTVHGNFEESASSIFTLQNSTNNNRVRIQGNVDAAGTITTALTTALPVLELNGAINQTISVTGNITNNVTFRINNSAGATLLAPLTLPYVLDLQNGKIKTDVTNVLTLIDNTTVAGGSASSFIEGPMIKIGDDNFTFPIGKGSIYAPIGFTSTGMATTDAFKAEYFRLNPQTAYGINYQSPINHVSFVEYWKLDKITGDVGIPAKVTLAVTQYSFAKDLATLYAARYNSSDMQWKNNDVTEKIPGPIVSPYVTGTVTSAPVSPFGIFTIATSEPWSVNPLPVILLSFNVAKMNDDKSQVTWQLADYYSEAVQFVVERSIDKDQFKEIKSLRSDPKDRSYTIIDNHSRYEKIRYRLKITNEDGSIAYSNIVQLMTDLKDEIILYPNPVLNKAVLNIYSLSDKNLGIAVYDATGRVVKKWKEGVYTGINQISIPVNEMKSGVYFISIEGRKESIRFIKQ